MPKPLKILGIHGLGDHRDSPWAQQWEETLIASWPGLEGFELTFVPFRYDEIFERIQLSAWETVRALGKLVGSGIGGMFGARGAAARGPLDSAQQWLRWYAGYVVAWVEDEEFRTEVRTRLLTTLADEKPDIVLAHSLGSLISYDALASVDEHPRSLTQHLGNMLYVTLGSQIGNPFVVGNLVNGRIEPLAVKQWYHLYNTEDDVFTAEVRVPAADNFLQVETYFDIAGFADHDALEYLRHPATVRQVWEPTDLERSGTRRLARSIATARKPMSTSRRPRRKALLVGINDYPNPADRLAGCVNDVFLMSSILQECGFTPDEIRVVLDNRATASGIKERLEWLVSDPAPGDRLVFYYSGHGAQLPTYGEADVVDQMDETLVPYDFDWSPATCVADDHIYHLYSQLPYETRLVMIFDCCHSGGIHREGGQKVRGLTPPDDIRHRGLQWNSALGMWQVRKLPPLTERFASNEEDKRRYAGSEGNVRRLGRAMQLRQSSAQEYQRAKARSDKKIVGPYLPVVIEACQEAELAYEYRHGVTSYGAFTYSLADILRRKKKITFDNLIRETGKRLTKLGYDQRPALLGPQKVVRAQVPWHGGGS